MKILLARWSECLCIALLFAQMAAPALAQPIIAFPKIQRVTEQARSLIESLSSTIEADPGELSASQLASHAESSSSAAYRDAIAQLEAILRDLREQKRSINEKLAETDPSNIDRIRRLQHMLRRVEEKISKCEEQLAALRREDSSKRRGQAHTQQGHLSGGHFTFSNPAEQGERMPGTYTARNGRIFAATLLHLDSNAWAAIVRTQAPSAGDMIARNDTKAATVLGFKIKGAGGGYQVLVWGSASDPQAAVADTPIFESPRFSDRGVARFLNLAQEINDSLGEGLIPAAALVAVARQPAPFTGGAGPPGSEAAAPPPAAPTVATPPATLTPTIIPTVATPVATLPPTIAPTVATPLATLTPTIIPTVATPITTGTVTASPTPAPLYCTTTGGCSAEGTTAIACTAENAREICAKTCSEDYTQCVMGGVSGLICETVDDCQQTCSTEGQCLFGNDFAARPIRRCHGRQINNPDCKTCSLDGACIFGGGGMPCTDENAATNCKTCNSTGLCVRGGVIIDGDPGVPRDPGVRCSDDSDCMTCNYTGECIPGGVDLHPRGTRRCTAHSDCMHCSDGACIPGAPRPPDPLGPRGEQFNCATANDCLFCNYSGQCVPGDRDGTTARKCSDNDDCLTCDSNRQCKTRVTSIENPGVPCTEETEATDCGVPAPPAERSPTPSQSKLTASNRAPASASSDINSYQRAALSNVTSIGATLGSTNAPVALEMYQDLRCGMCAYAFKNATQRIISEYVNTGLVRLEFKEFPLTKSAAEMLLAQAVQCAGDQNQYYRYLERIYTLGHDDKIDLELLYKIAKEEGLQEDQFKSCLETKKHLPTVERDAKNANELGLNGTPTFYVNGTQVLGAKPFEVFRAMIEAELRKS